MYNMEPYLDTRYYRCSSAPTCPRRTLLRWEASDSCRCGSVSARLARSARYRETSLSTMTSLRSLVVREDEERRGCWENSLLRRWLTAQRFIWSLSKSVSWWNNWAVIATMINGARVEFFDLSPETWLFDWLISSVPPDTSRKRYCALWMTDGPQHLAVRND